jgi:hypothetical protein
MLNWERISLGSGEESTEFVATAANTAYDVQPRNGTVDEENGEMYLYYARSPSNRYVVKTGPDLVPTYYAPANYFTDTTNGNRTADGAEMGHNKYHPFSNDFAAIGIKKAPRILDIDSPYQAPNPYSYGNVQNYSEYMFPGNEWQYGQMRGGMTNGDRNVYLWSKDYGAGFCKFDPAFTSPSNFDAKHNDDSFYSSSGSGMIGVAPEQKDNTNSAWFTVNGSGYHGRVARLNSSLTRTPAYNISYPSNWYPNGNLAYYSNVVYDQTYGFLYWGYGSRLFEADIGTSSPTVKYRDFSVSALDNGSPCLRIKNGYLYYGGTTRGTNGSYIWRFALGSSGLAGFAGQRYQLRSTGYQNRFGHENMFFHVDDDDHIWMSADQKHTADGARTRMTVIKAKWDTYATLGTAGIQMSVSSINVSAAASTALTGLSYTNQPGTDFAAISGNYQPKSQSLTISSPTTTYFGANDVDLYNL